MGIDRYVSTPAAILIGSAVIAAALFFGLQQRHDPHPDERPQAPPPASGAVSEAAARPRARAPEPAAPPPAPSPGASREVVTQQAGKALGAHRAALVKRCWEPAVAKAPEPRTIRYVFNLAFDAAGREVARGVIEDRETARIDVTRCVGENLPPIEVPPPGAVISVEVPFSLP
jgi:hypothetical protein